MDLEERVNRIERSQRCWRGVAVIAIIAALGIAAGKPTISDEVNTKLLRVYDAKGEVTFMAGSFAENSTRIEIRRGGETAFTFQAEEGNNIMGINRPGRDNPQILMTADAGSAFISLQPDYAKAKGSSATAIGSIDGAGFIQLRGAKGGKSFEKP